MIICVCGPTASKKSRLAQKLAVIYNAKIINADAFQVYRDLKIGVNKPKRDILDKYNYQLIDFLEMDAPFSIAEYQKMAREIIDQSLANNENIIIEGGSGLYIKSLLYDYNFPSKTLQLVNNYDEYDNETLYKMLLERDPESTKTIHQNNRKRLIRALQIFDETGEQKTAHINKQEHRLIYNDVTFIALDIERAVLYERINERVEVMFEAGLKKEVIELLKRFPEDLQSLQAIGYKEVIEGINNNESDIVIKERIKKNTRNYAKRQVTYFKHQLPVHYFKTDEEAISWLEDRLNA